MTRTRTLIGATAFAAALGIAHAQATNPPAARPATTR
jgi:hypothetical protein